MTTITIPINLISNLFLYWCGFCFISFIILLICSILELNPYETQLMYYVNKFECNESLKLVVFGIIYLLSVCVFASYILIKTIEFIISLNINIVFT